MGLFNQMIIFLFFFFFFIYLTAEWWTYIWESSDFITPTEGTAIPAKQQKPSWLREPWTEEPGGLQSSGSQRVGQDRATSLFTFFHMPYVFSYPHILTTHPAFPLHHHPGLVTVVPHPTHHSDLLSGPYISFPTGQSEGPVKRTS